MKRTVRWHLMPCSLVEVHWRFRRIYCLHLQGKKVSFALLGLLFDLDDEGNAFLQNVELLPYHTVLENRSN
jgi:hypothetical protein